MAKRFIYSKLYRHLPRIAGWFILLIGLATLSFGLLVLLSSKGLISNIPLFESTLLNPQFIPIGAILISVGALFTLLSPLLLMIQHRRDTRRKCHEATLVIRNADSKVDDYARKPYNKPDLSPGSTVDEYSITSPRVGDQSMLAPYSTDTEIPFLKKS